MDPHELVTIYAHTVMPRMKALAEAAKPNPYDTELLRQLTTRYAPTSSTISAVIDSDAKVILELTLNSNIRSVATQRGLIDCLKAFAKARELVVGATRGLRAKFPRGLLMDTNWAELAESFGH